MTYDSEGTMFNPGIYKRPSNQFRDTYTPAAGAQEGELVIRAQWLIWLWPTIIVLSAIAVDLVTFVFPASVVRPEVVMWFLFVCPGMTVVCFFRRTETVIGWMLAIALSLAIDAFTAGILLYAGWWSPALILRILIGFCLIGAVMELIVIRPGTTEFDLNQTHVVDSTRHPKKRNDP